MIRIEAGRSAASRTARALLIGLVSTVLPTYQAVAQARELPRPWRSAQTGVAAKLSPHSLPVLVQSVGFEARKPVEGTVPALPWTPASEGTRVHWGATAILIAGTIASDRPIRDFARGNRSEATNAVAGFTNPLGDKDLIVPAFGVVYLSGLAFRRPQWSAGGLHVLEAYGTTAAIVAGLKWAVGRPRPYEGEWDDLDPFGGTYSFPSGHTATAFTVATTLARRSRSRTVRVLLYTGAVLTGLSRINDDEHWASDVLSGAVVGYVSASRLTPRIFDWH